MKYTSNKDLKEYAQDLRKNMTPQERKLWYDFLKTLPYRVKRQYVIGSYITDFYCEKVKTVIELDGSQHFDDIGKAEDAARTEYLNKLGVKVLRYSNKDINMNFTGVCNDILLNFGIIDKL